MLRISGRFGMSSAVVLLLALPTPAAGHGNTMAAGIGEATAPPSASPALPESLTLAAAAATGTGCGPFTTRGATPTEQGCATADSTGAGPGGQASGLSLSSSGRVDTTRWFADIRARSDGSFVRVHGYGDVAAVAADGAILWRRPSASFYGDWDITPHVVPTVPIGVAPLYPATLASEDAWSVADASGDGIEDVAVGHVVTTEEVGANDEPYEYQRSFVTLLDGRDGRTLWHKEYPRHVSHALLVDGLLLVGNETGDRTGTSFVSGEDGSRTALHALQVSPLQDGVAVEPAWTFDTGVERERLLAIEPVGSQRLAVARPSGVHVLDAATGAVEWTAPITGFPRVLRYDSTRDLVVVHELHGFGTTVSSYALLGFRAADGQRVVDLPRDDAILLSLDVADVTGGPEAEWVVGEVGLIPGKPTTVLASTYQEGRVTVLDPAQDSPVWSHRVEAGDDLVAGRTGGTSVPLFYGVQTVGDVVVTAWFDVNGPQGLAGLDGDTGGMLWEEYGPETVFPVFLQSGMVDGHSAVLTATPHQLVRAHAIDDGVVLTRAPALADILAVTDADVDGDGTTDLVVGSESGGVFALDGANLDRILWQAVASGPVHQLELSDLDGDGAAEVVAAAHRGVDVLRLDGSPAFTVARPAPDLVWTITLGDLDGDGLDDLLVPSRSLSAWRGKDGAALWEFLPAVSEDLEPRFSTSVITPEGRAVSQFLTRKWVGANPVTSRAERQLVGIDGRTGLIEWLRPDVDVVGITRLWRSVTLVPGEGGDSTAVALTWDEQTGTGSGPWRPVTDVVDSATGEVLRSVGAVEGIVHMGTLFLQPYGLVGFDWNRMARLAPDGLVETDLDRLLTDVSVLDVGDDQLLVGAGLQGLAADVHLYGVDVPFAGGHAGDALATWTGLNVGRLHVSDLDGDGADEAVAFSFDWPTYIQVNSWEGTFTYVPDPYFHGLVILEVST